MAVGHHLVLLYFYTQSNLCPAGSLSSAFQHCLTAHRYDAVQVVQTINVSLRLILVFNFFSFVCECGACVYMQRSGRRLVEVSCFAMLIVGAEIPLSIMSASPKATELSCWPLMTVTSFRY